MSFLKKRKKIHSETFNIDEVKVATATVTSYRARLKKNKQISTQCYFLVRELNGKYFEIFSNKQLKTISDTCLDNAVICQYFDTPYIKSIEPLNKYLENLGEKKVIESQDLFDFILNLNVQERFKYLFKEFD